MQRKYDCNLKQCSVCFVRTKSEIRLVRSIHYYNQSKSCVLKFDLLILTLQNIVMKKNIVSYLFIIIFACDFRDIFF